MKKRWDILLPGVIVAFIFTLTAAFAKAQAAPDHTLYAALLKSYVKNGKVDYQGFKNDKKLESYLGQLAQVHPKTLSRSDQMAFYINAYNAWTIKLIVDHYPGVASIKELGSFFQSPWKKKFVKLEGGTVSLDHIEHEILRPVYRDPRIHFAVNCASKSCPPLLDEPYTGKALDGQLDQMARKFINDPHSNYMKGDTLYLSSIFKWFREDFGQDLTGFIQTYARGDLARQLKMQADPKIRYLKYDWSLNGK